MSKFLFILTVLLSIVSCKKELSTEEKANFTQKGKAIAEATAKAMLAEVGKNMKEGGVSQAIPFCNAHASELTERIATSYEANIKRTSHKIRNVNHAPTVKEQQIIDLYLKQQVESIALKPIVERMNNGKIQFYAPIFLADKCTVCHGVLGETLTSENNDLIKTLYPEDHAIGFKEGDIRGIWSIQFSE